MSWALMLASWKRRISQTSRAPDDIALWRAVWPEMKLYDIINTARNKGLLNTELLQALGIKSVISMATE